MTHARIYAQQRFFYSPELDDAQWTRLREGLTTSAGNAGGTTVIDTNSDSATANLYNGDCWIRIKSGVCEGEEQRIVEDNGTGTYTVLDAFSAQVASGVYFEIWRSPESVAVCSSSQLATTTFSDDDRNEDDHTWVDSYAMVIQGANSGLSRKITAFDKAGGAAEGLFTTEAFPTAHLEGDVILLVKWLDIEPTTPGIAQAFHPRPGNRDTGGKGKGTPGARSGTFAFNSDVLASGTLAASGSRANQSVLGFLLKSCGFDETVDTSSTIAAGSTTTVLKVATGSHENHTIGGFVMVNGQIRPVTDKDDNAGSADDITVSPALQVVPAASDVLYALRSYRPSVTRDIPACTLYLDIDNIRHVMTGCKGNVQWTNGAPPQLAFSFNVDHWIRNIVAAPTVGQPVYTTASAVLSDSMRCYINSTLVNVAGLTGSLNATIVPRDIQGAQGLNGRTGFQMTGADPGMSLRGLIGTTDTQLDAQNWFYRQTSLDIMAILGSGANSFVVRSPVSVAEELHGTSNENGLVGAPVVLRSKDAGTVAWDSDNGGNDDTITKVPDFAFGLT